MILNTIFKILFHPSVPNFEYCLLSIIVLFVDYIVITWFLTLILTKTPIFKSKREFIDADTRVLLCWSISFIIGIFLMTANICYIWIKNTYEGWEDLIPHWTVLVIFTIIWILISIRIKGDFRKARKALPD